MADGTEGPGGPGGPGGQAGQETPEQLRAKMDAELRQAMEAELAAAAEPPKKFVSPAAARAAANHQVLGAEPTAAAPPQGILGRLTSGDAWSKALSDPLSSGTVVREILNAARGLPGMGALESGAGAIGMKVAHPELSWGDAYRQSHNTLESETSQIPATRRIPERIIGGAALFPAAAAEGLVGSGAAFGGPAMATAMKAAPIATSALTGATLGAADPLLSGDPNLGFLDRLKQARTGAEIGGLVGGGLHAAAEPIMGAAKTVAGVARASLPEWLGGTPDLAKQVQQLEAERASVGPMYERSIATAAKPTPQIQAFLREPDAQTRIMTLQQKDQFQGMRPDDPRMLDALVKSYSDGIKQLENQLAPVDPALANTRSASIADLRSKRARLLEAMGTPGQVPAVTQTLPGRDQTVLGPMGRNGLDEPAFQLRGRPPETITTVPARQTQPMMPGYPAAFTRASDLAGEREAFDLGLAAMQRAARDGAITRDQLSKLSIPAVEQWASTATPVQRQKAMQAIYGAATEDARTAAFSKGQNLLTAAAALTGHAPVGGALAVGRMLPSAARANALREILDPTSPLGQPDFMQMLAALNAPFTR